MEIKGTIKTILPIQSGAKTDGTGDWKKVNFVVANNEGYNDQEQLFCFEIFGEEKVDKFMQYNKLGDKVEVSFNIRTNEYKGKYYTSLQCWKCFTDNGEQQNNAPAPDNANEPDDLPF